MPSNITHNAKMMGNEMANQMELQRKIIPTRICSNAESMRVPLLGRNLCVRRVNTKREIPAASVKQPIITAKESRVASGLIKHVTPIAINRIPVIPNQIFVLFFIFK